ncbi:SOS response-associated peptidase [Candidatus Bathyarchaeota archaeon]|nr:SOS response-associated peptidase [Candidatus Bathyarchaeota archaeon]
MPVHDAPADDADDAPRSSYNFAPGYHGVVYRAEGAQTDSHGATNGAGDDTAAKAGEGVAEEAPAEESPRYKLQSMKWGLVPSWTKRNPKYGFTLKTINCRADSLAKPGGLWSSMKGRKRCVVVADGFFEWLKVGPKDKVPHYVRRGDGQPMLFAGLWDCVSFEGELYPGQAGHLFPLRPKAWRVSIQSGRGVNAG